jgi:hypothetical protein
VPEALTEQLEERAGRGIRVDDEDGGHASNVDPPRRERRVRMV